MSTPENTKLCDFTSTNNGDFICTPIAPPAATTFYEIKPALLNLVMREQFSGASSDDAAAHLNNFVELCEMQKYKDVDGDIIKLKLFPFSLRGKAKDWFLSLPRNSIDSWIKCKDAFISKFYPPAKIISMRSDIMKFRQYDNKHVAQAWERMKSLVKNCPTHGLTTWMIIQTFYAGLNFSSRNLLDSAAGGTFMSLTLGAATKLLDGMMINYSEWHTERAPQGKKVNSVEETSSLSDKIDTIMAMLVNDKSHVDPNNVPLASLVAQEDHVDVNFIKSNNFNNNAYRNFGNNNYRPFPASGNGYGNAYGNSYSSNKSAPSELEVMLKDFIAKQTAFNKIVEKKFGKIDALVAKVDSLALDVDLLKMKVLSPDAKENKVSHVSPFAATNAIQVQIDDNIRMLAKLHARWEREDEIARQNNASSVCTITTTCDTEVPHDSTPPTINGRKFTPVSTPAAKLPRTAVVSDKSAEIFYAMRDSGRITFDHNDFDFDSCNIPEVISFLQKLAKSPNASAINLSFTEHITKILMQAREEKLKREASIPRKLEDSCEAIIKVKVNDFDCNALCDLGASISVMPKKLFDMLDLPPLEHCYLDVYFADNVKKKHLGRVNNVHIMVNNNLVPVDFVVLDIDCNASCPIVLGRPFLRTVGAVIDMREGNIKYHFPLKKGMEHFPRKRKKLPFDSIIRASYASSLENT
jgi:hypothetical protein